MLVTIPESARESNLSKQNLQALNNSKLIGRVETQKFQINSKQLDPIKESQRRKAANKSVLSASNSHSVMSARPREETKLSKNAIKLKAHVLDLQDHKNIDNQTSMEKI